MSSRLADEIVQRLSLEEVFARTERIQFALGPIQLLTLACFIAAVLALGASVKWNDMQEVGKGLSEIIPYLGFLGTLIGMGGALGILGRANLADELSKATSLGPVGSQLSIAIQTTKYALVLFIVVKLIDIGCDTMRSGDRSTGEG